ncbi:MAG: hypothetical protein IT365_21895 [Candidatus Hydrogenedentes bacterium]|nr:hypothetical protein [Candidatus Hydrogenedentota bacterium]
MAHRLPILTLAGLACAIVGCGVFDSRPSLSGQITYDDMGKFPDLELLPITNVTVFACVGTFPPPAPQKARVWRDKPDPSSPKAARMKEIDDLLASMPESFAWRGAPSKPRFDGAEYTRYQVRADAEGNYAFPDLPEGTCYVCVLYHVQNRDGLWRESMPRKTTIKKGEPTRLDILLTRFDVVDI